LITCLPALALLAAVGISKMPFPTASIVLVATLVGLSTGGVSAYYQHYEKEDWRGAASVLVSHWEPGDGILYYVPYGQNKLDYYIRKISSGTLDGHAIVRYSPWADFVAEEPDRQAIADFLPDDYDRIWLVLSRDESSEERKVRDEIELGLGMKYQLYRVSDHPKVTLVLFGNGQLPSFLGGYTPEQCQRLAVDASGNANHGLLENGSRRIAGKLGDALYLSKDRDYVSIGDVHDFTGTAPFTVALWAKDSKPAGRLVSKEKSTDPREGWLIFSSKNEGRYVLERWQSGAHDDINFEYPSGQWNHIAFTYDGAHMKGYLNGKLAAGPTESAKSIQPTFDPLVVGARSDARTGFYQGMLDDIRIYDRSLDGAEIAELAQRTGNAPMPGDGLASYWKFDEEGNDTAAACGVRGVSLPQ
jgi:hypothetical protein